MFPLYCPEFNEVSICSVSFFEMICLLGLLSFNELNDTKFLLVPLKMVLLNPLDPIKVPFTFEISEEGLT